MEQENCMPEGHAILSNAIQEAELLLAYASSHSIQLDDTIVKTLIQAKQLLEESALIAERSEQEAAFWAANAVLARAVRPISAESLKQCTVLKSTTGWMPNWLNKLLGRKLQAATGVEIFIAKIQFRLFFPITLLLLVQIYSLAGSGLVGDLIPRMEKMQNLQIEASKAAFDEGKEKDQTLKTIAKQVEVTQIEIEIRIDMLAKWSAGWRWIAIPFTSSNTTFDAKQATESGVNAQYQLHRAVVLKAQFLSLIHI
jgi:hypothetical protein